MPALLVTGMGCGDPQPRQGDATPELTSASVSAIVLDGRVGADEWGVATSIPEGGDVLTKAHGDRLYLAARTNVALPVHVYLGRADGSGEEVQVLHASASLGRTVYRRAVGGEWELADPFAWEVLDPALGSIADSVGLEAERSAYLARDGWAANTMFMGSPGEVEFALSRSYIDDFELIAMSYIWLAPDSIEHIRHWPASAEITPREYDLLMGEGVPADFALESWMELGRMAR